MGDSTFEFISTTSETIATSACVKSEPTECNAIDDKCGEIRLQHDGDFTFVCGFCQFKCSTVIDFGAHLKEQHQEKIFTIQHLLKLATDDVLTTEIKDDPENSIECDTVKVTTVFQTDSLCNTEEQDSSKSLLACNICGKSFKHKVRLRAHERASKCQKISAEDLALQSAKQCSMCNKSFKGAEFLKRHIARFHKEENLNKIENIEQIPPLPNKLDTCIGDLLDTSVLDVSMAEISTKQELPHDEFVDAHDNDDESFKASSDAWSDDQCRSGKEAKESKAESKPVECDVCHRKYKTRRNMLKHKKTTGCSQEPTIENPELYCTLCNRELKTKRTFRRHMKTHDKNSKEAINNAEAKSIIEDPSLFCELCGRFFKSRSKFRLHADTHSSIPLALQGDPDYLKCKFCYKQFDDFATRKTHETTHNRDQSETEPKSRRCKYCNEEFPTRAECMEHQDTHVGEKRFICLYCPNKYRTNYGRQRHMRVHTGERPYQCTECPRAFGHKVQLDYHIRKHKNLREFSCKTCNKSFYRKFELNLHERRHSGFRPLVCEDCGKRFNSNSDLNEHRKRHTDAKDWKCEVCNKCFYSKWELKDHMIGHTSETPFACEVCGRKFSRSKALKKHKKLHSDVKAYVCGICGKAYAQDSGLYAHKKTHGIASTDKRNSVATRVDLDDL